MMGIIHVRGIRCYAYHGCLPEEAIIGGEYIIDTWIKTDLSEAAASDDILDTVDYSDIHRIVKREMQVRSKLVEHVCRRILEALVKELPRVKKIKVRVTKIN